MSTHTHSNLFSLLVEIVETSNDVDGFHQTTVDAFESAVHSLLDKESSILLWRQYLLHLRFNAGLSYENWSMYLSSTKRCLQAVDNQLFVPITDFKQRQCNEYSFHNEVKIPLYKVCLIHSFLSDN